MEPTQPSNNDPGNSIPFQRSIGASEPGRVIYYDYSHCREFLEQRAADLRVKEKGLETLALFRELYYSFSYEALEQNSITLGQFDTGVVFAFIPSELNPNDYPETNALARAKAIELLNSKNPPLVMELISSQKREPQIGERGRMERWMRAEFLNDMITSERIHIHLYFDGAALYNEVLKPQLEQCQFELLDSYVTCARNEVIRVRHPNTPGKIIMIPWLVWVREMMGGGYGVVYILACFNIYLQKLQQAVEGSAQTTR